MTQTKSDQTREAVLTYLFSLHTTDPLSWTGTATIKKELSSFSSAQVLASLTFLVEAKYIKKKKSTLIGLSDFYQITNKGIHAIEPSAFHAKPMSPISISSKGGIFVFGNNLGTIKQETVLSFEEITSLVSLIQKAEVPLEKKRDMIADAETIRAQLTKPKPDKTILAKAWQTVKMAATLDDAWQLVEKIRVLLLPFLS